MRKSFFVCCAIIVAHSSVSQIVRIDSTTNWRRSFKAGLNLNQAAFSSNWKAGGVNSFGFNALLHYNANYQKGKNSWNNEIDLLYGMVNNQGQGYRKTLDRMYLDTKYARDISEKWNAFFALNLSSQFAKGYKYVKDANGVEQANLISDIFAPAFVTSTLGFEYDPVDYFKVRISPLASRVTILSESERFVFVDSVAPYGVEIGENYRVERLAFQLLAEFNKEVATNLSLTWRYLFFANYETLEGKKIDHRLDLNLTAKVNKFVNVSLGGILLYDYDQDHEAQYSQAFSLGVLYTFQNYQDKKK